MFKRLPAQWQSLLRDNAYVGLSTILIQVSGILFSALFARQSVEGFAFFQYFLSIIGLLSIFSFPGLAQSLKIEIARGAYPLNQFFKAKIKYSLLSATIALIAAGVFRLLGRVEIALALLCVVPFLPLYYTLPLYGVALEGKLQFDLLSQLRVAKMITLNLLLVITILLHRSPFFVSLSFVWLNIILDGLAFLYLQPRVQNHPLAHEEFSKALIYAKNLTYISSLGIVRQHMDRFAVGSFLPPASLAIYAIASGLSQRLRVVSNTISRTLFPRMASLSESQVQSVIRRQFFRWLLFTIMICLAAIALARPYIILIYGHNYTDAVPLSYILIGIIGVGMLSMPLAILFESQGNATALYRTNALASILEIGLTLLLVPLFQLAGILWSKSVSRVYLLSGLAYLFSRLTKHAE